MNLDKILMKVLNDKASQEEYAILEEWKNASAENLEYIKILMEKSKGSTKQYKQYDVNSGWQKVDKRTRSTQSSGYIKWISLVLIFAMLFVGIKIWSNKKDANPTHFASNNQQIEFQLQDATNIWLNHNSTLDRVSEFENQREVALNGEAFFDVAEDASRPFVIHLNETDFIRVLGTSFNVINEGENIDVYVKSGHVQVHVLERDIDLYAGDRISFVDGAFVKTKNNDNNILSWKEKVLVFDNTGIQEVFNELSDYFNVEFTVDAETDLSSCKLRSKFVNQNLESVMEELSTIYNLSYTLESNQVNISKLKCN